ncbi:MAG: HlyC/CorC family transporter [Anaerolineales bacterium]|nr:HlyC/CorC family transporter [Anaerolineales bacterium]
MLDYTTGLIAIISLLLVNGFLAAGRAALVNASRGRLRQWAEAGDGGAERALRVAEAATALLATLRLTQTFCRFGLAGLAALLFAQPLDAAVQQWVTLSAPAEGVLFSLGLLLVTILVVSLGEFLPEALALRNPEQAALYFAPLVGALIWLLAPVVRLTLWLASRISAPVAGQRAPLVTEEEIKTLVDAGEEGGAIEEDEKEMIYSIFEISETWVRELMVPRIDVLALDVETRRVEAVDALLDAGHSRAPIYEGSIDHIVGILYVKDLLRAWRAGEVEAPLRGLLRPAYFVPETKKANDLLAELQQKRIHIAVVVDEYGGTAGIVTLEDIVEEIVGDIRDEYDGDEESYIERLSDADYIFDARLDLDEVNELLGVRLPSDDSDSLGGFIYSQLGHIPAAGESAAAEGVQFEVLTVTGRRIRKVRATRLLPAPPVETPPAEPPRPEPPRRGNGTQPLPPVENPAHE